MTAHTKSRCANAAYEDDDETSECQAPETLVMWRSRRRRHHGAGENDGGDGRGFESLNLNKMLLRKPSRRRSSTTMK